MLPSIYYDRDSVRELDRSAIASGIPGYELMQQAALAALEVIVKDFPQTQCLYIFCGAGNNAGDGYSLARYAAERGMHVEVIQVGDIASLKNDALQSYKDCNDTNVVMHTFCKEETQNKILLGITKHVDCLLVDALLGTGLDRDLRDEYYMAVELLNNLPIPTLSLDIPTGLDADKGIVLGNAVVADSTITFIGVNQGLLTGIAKNYVGNLIYSSLDIPHSVSNKVKPCGEILHIEKYLGLLPPRKAAAHKGNVGHVLIVGGYKGMGGAPLLSALGALRSGCGLVTIATHPEHVGAIVAKQPEIMVHPINSPKDLLPLIGKVDVIVCGPGLSQSDWGKSLYSTVLASNKHLVLDADALNILAMDEKISFDNSIRDVVLTPHPKEAARLLHSDVISCEDNRFATIGNLVTKYNAYIILKGAGTLVGGPNTSPSVCIYGNPGMASGGMGDLLSGIIASLIGQGMNVANASKLAVCIHSLAADLDSKKHGERGMIATDLLHEIRMMVGS